MPSGRGGRAGARPEAKAFAVPLDRARPAFGEMEADHGAAALHQLGQKGDAGCGGALGLLVVAADPFGAAQGDVMVGDRIAQDHHRPFGRRHVEGHVARRVAGREAGEDAWRDRVAVLDQRDAVQCLQPARRADGEGLPRLADRLHGGGIGPVGMLRSADHVLGLGEVRIVEVVQHAPQMVGVRVGEDHVRHVLGRDAESVQSVGQLADRWLEGGTPARIEQDGPFAVAQERDVAGRGQPLGVHLGELREHFGELVLRHGLEHELAGQDQRAVRQRVERHPVAEVQRRAGPGGVHGQRQGRGGGPQEDGAASDHGACSP